MSLYHRLQRKKLKKVHDKRKKIQRVIRHLAD